MLLLFLKRGWMCVYRNEEKEKQGTRQELITRRILVCHLAKQCTAHGYPIILWFISWKINCHHEIGRVTYITRKY